MKHFFSLLILLGTLSSCKKQAPAPEFGYEYFGLEEGRFVTYDVMEIFHDVQLTPAHDTVRYTLKTVIGEEVVDNEGRTARKMYRYSYDPQSGDLIDQRVWTAVIDQGRGEVVEENQRKIRMVFAVTLDKEWDVNAFNPADKEEVFYDEIFQPYSIGNFTIDSTVRVEYEDFFSLIDYQRKYEVYGKNIGLIHRSFIDLRINNFDVTSIQSGTEVHYTLKDYGME
ncbi:MAG: hypothetical protein R3277_03800 [Brumimicrobium sp.]|nr:hypothetical protein [Brumimicrobium sp.]